MCISFLWIGEICSHQLPRIQVKILCPQTDTINLETFRINKLIPFWSKRKQVIKYIGTPDSIIYYRSDPGDTSYLYYFGHICFTSYSDSLKFRSIYFDSKSKNSISISGFTVDCNTKIDQIKQKFAYSTISVIDEGLKTESKILWCPAKPNWSPDPNYVGYSDALQFIFSNGALVQIYAWEDD